MQYNFDINIYIEVNALWLKCVKNNQKFSSLFLNYLNYIADREFCKKYGTSITGDSYLKCSSKLLSLNYIIINYGEIPKKYKKDLFYQGIYQQNITIELWYSNFKEKFGILKLIKDPGDLNLSIAIEEHIKNIFNKYQNYNLKQLKKIVLNLKEFKNTPQIYLINWKELLIQFKYSSEEIKEIVERNNFIKLLNNG